MDSKKLIDSIRKIPDYPKPGILFYDITTMIGNKEIFCELIQSLAERYKHRDIDFVAGIESRGFIFGSALAYALGVGFVPIRKKGKLPFTTVSEKYSLEYGFDEVEIHIDAFGDKKMRVLCLLMILLPLGALHKQERSLSKHLAHNAWRRCLFCICANLEEKQSSKSFVMCIVC